MIPVCLFLAHDQNYDAIFRSQYKEGEEKKHPQKRHCLGSLREEHVMEINFASPTLQRSPSPLRCIIAVIFFSFPPPPLNPACLQQHHHVRLFLKTRHFQHLTTEIWNSSTLPLPSTIFDVLSPSSESSRPSVTSAAETHER